jgi:hypothetical protein
MAEGKGSIVITMLVRQPVGSVYVMAAVPPLIPVTTPLDAPMVATPVEPLLHVPPGLELVSVVVEPWQRV